MAVKIIILKHFFTSEGTVGVRKKELEGSR